MNNYQALRRAIGIISSDAMEFVLNQDWPSNDYTADGEAMATAIQFLTEAADEWERGGADEPMDPRFDREGQLIEQDEDDNRDIEWVEMMLGAPVA